MISSHIPNSNEEGESEEEDEDVQQVPKKGVRAKDIPIFKRCDRFDHWPQLSNVVYAQRCKMERCKRKTKFKFTKCKLFLCVSDECFLKFHGVD